jgi:hypothetical protein
VSSETPQTQHPDSPSPSVLVRLGGDTQSAVRHAIATVDFNLANEDIKWIDAALRALDLVARDLAAAESAEPVPICPNGVSSIVTTHNGPCPVCDAPIPPKFDRAPSTNTPTNHVHNDGQLCPCDGCDW